MKKTRRLLRRHIFIPISSAVRNRRLLFAISVPTITILILFFTLRQPSNKNEYISIPTSRFHRQKSIPHTLTLIAVCYSANCTIDYISTDEKHPSVTNILLIICHPPLDFIKQQHPSYITLINVDNCPRFATASLLNIAASLSRCEYLLFISSPCIKLLSSFSFNNHDSTVFYTWSAIDWYSYPRQHSALLVSRIQFLNSHGLNGIIPSTSTSLQYASKRLQQQSLTRLYFTNNSFKIFSHQDDNDFDLCIDALTLNSLYSSEYSSEYEVISYSTSHIHLSITTTCNGECELIPRMITAAQMQYMHEMYNVPWDTVHAIERSGTHAANKIYNSLRFGNVKGVVIIKVKHGLCNRLRALSSAIALGNTTKEAVIIDWRIDEHYGAPLNSVLLHMDNILSIDSIQVPVIIIRGRLKVNKMHSSDIFSNELDREIENVDWKLTTKVLKSLPFVDLKLDEYENRLKDSICVHVRHESYTNDIKGVVGMKEYEEDWEIGQTFRRVSSPEIIGMRAIEIAEKLKRKHIFIISDNSTDSIKRIRQLAHNHDIQVWGNENECVDRSSKCVKFAVKDLIMIGKCDFIVGSAYSSFTDVAARLAGVKPLLAGLDFGQQSLHQLLMDVSHDGRNRIMSMVKKHRRQQKKTK